MIDDIKIYGSYEEKRGRQKIGKTGQCWTRNERPTLGQNNMNEMKLLPFLLVPSPALIRSTYMVFEGKRAGHTEKVPKKNGIITLRHRIRNEDIRSQTHIKDAAETADKLKKKWAGHVMRLNTDRCHNPDDLRNYAVKLTGFLEFGKDAATLPPRGFDGHLSILLNESCDWLLTGGDKISVTKTGRGGEISFKEPHHHVQCLSVRLSEVSVSRVQMIIGGEVRQSVSWRPEGKIPLGMQRRRWEDNIKMDLREVGHDGRDWFNLAQGRDQWRAYVGAAMNLRVP
ncbi:hypothetical protein ANN_23615 [Periplaneta americana]|uniref:Uncharacterized protein n=1 Tax=Periplaneta americana TaxID=6978 RepID=A0ABQ8SLM0_PERAM|nr:hypothetical protein ANN_23615 [Periplaneta americana]